MQVSLCFQASLACVFLLPLLASLPATSARTLPQLQFGAAKKYIKPAPPAISLGQFEEQRLRKRISSSVDKATPQSLVKRQMLEKPLTFSKEVPSLVPGPTESVESSEGSETEKYRKHRLNDWLTSTTEMSVRSRQHSTASAMDHWPYSARNDRLTPVIIPHDSTSQSPFWPSSRIAFQPLRAASDRGVRKRMSLLEESAGSPTVPERRSQSDPNLQSKSQAQKSGSFLKAALETRRVVAGSQIVEPQVTPKRCSCLPRVAVPKISQWCPCRPPRPSIEGQRQVEIMPGIPPRTERQGGTSRRTGSRSSTERKSRMDSHTRWLRRKWEVEKQNSRGGKWHVLDPEKLNHIT